MPKYVDLGYNGSLSIAEIMAAAKQGIHTDNSSKESTEKEKGGGKHGVDVYRRE